MRGIGAASFASHIRKHLVTEEFVQRPDATPCFIRPRMLGNNVPKINCQDIGNRDLTGITAAFSGLSRVLVREIGGESAFGSFKIVCKTACALIAAFVA